MINKSVIFLFFMFVFLTPPAISGDEIWTEKKLGKLILKADRAALQKRWHRAIKYGDKILDGAEALNQHSDARYINLLKNVNKYYDKAGRLRDIPSRIKNGYILSNRYLGPSHATSITSRNLYYKLLIANKNYSEAIPLINENTSILTSSREDRFRKLHYLEQLVHLYGLTRKYEKEEKTLLSLIDLNKKLFGKSDEGHTNAILMLAENYCRQQKMAEFAELISQNNLKYYCKYYVK